MKKILFFAICLSIAGAVSAQGYYYGPRRIVRRPRPRPQTDDFYRVRFGITGGLNIANTVDAYNPNFGTAAIAGFNAGFFLDIPLAFPVSFEPEVLYSQKGYAASTQDGNFTQRSNYLDVPLLLKFKMGPNFNFLVGPQVSFPLSTTNTYDNGFQIINEQYYNTSNNGTVLDGVVGVSFDLSPDVELRARYTIDLTPNNAVDNYTPDYRNQVIQIGLGFKFQ
jgi:hypothetical protein